MRPITTSRHMYCTQECWRLCIIYLCTYTAHAQFLYSYGLHQEMAYINREQISYSLNSYHYNMKYPSVVGLVSYELVTNMLLVLHNILGKCQPMHLYVTAP